MIKYDFGDLKQSITLRSSHFCVELKMSNLVRLCCNDCYNSFPIVKITSILCGFTISLP